VVAAVVLDVEVAVEALRQRDLGQPPLVALLLVAQLVGGVDADATDAADRDRQPDLAPQGDVAAGAQRVTAGDEVHRGDEPDVLDRQEQVGDPPVVAVLLEGVDDVVRRVGAVEPRDQVDRRYDDQDHHRADPEQAGPPGRQPAAVPDEEQARHDQPDQPQVPLRVPPPIGRPLRHGGVGDGVHGDSLLYRSPTTVKRFT
jgi:hypothetical protein